MIPDQHNSIPQTSELPSHLRIEAGDAARFMIALDPSAVESRCTVGGVPSAWVKCVGRRTAVEIRVSVPLSTPPGIYPVSIMLGAPQDAGKTITLGLTLEIAPSPGAALPARQILASPQSLVLAALVLVGIWLALSYGRGESNMGGESLSHTQSARVDLAPLGNAPSVLIGADWSAAMATPAPMPTPTLRPTPTPLPPLPTPQPPPPTPFAERGAEAAVDGPYTYQRLFEEVGAQFGIDWRLLASIADRESGLDPAAVGRSGEQGIMQIMPATWRQFSPPLGESDPFDPYASARVSAYYLAYLRDYLYSQGLTESYWLLVAYNWGPSNLRRQIAEGGDWGDIPSIRQEYARTIIDLMNHPVDALWTERLSREVPR